MTIKRAVAYGVAGLVALGAAYGAGRFTAPSKVVTKVEVQERVVYRDHEVKVEGPVHVVTVTRDRPATAVPAGCPECEAVHETTTTEERGPVVTTTEREGERDTSSVATSTTEREYPRLTVGVDAGAASFKDFVHPRWGVHAGYRFWGPLSVTGRYEPRDKAAFVGLAFTF